MKEECGTCRFWIVLQGYQGECHKLSPSEGSWGGGHYDAVWPETTSDRWCGEYERAEEKKDEV